MSDSPPPPPGSAPPPGQYPPTAPQPGYGFPPPVGYPPAADPAAPYPPAGGYPPPTQAGWGAGGGTPPPYGGPPPSDPGGRKVLLIVLGVVFGLAALVVVGAVALVVVGRDSDDNAATVDRTTIAPVTVPEAEDDTTATTSDAQPGDSALDPDTSTADTGDREGENVNVFDLGVGDCFDVPTSGNISDVTGLDCDEPHDNEVFATFEVPGDDDAPFPGDDAISDQAQSQCTGALFTDYVGVPFAQSRFDATSINPTRETWESDLADREVLCVATGPDGETLTASVRGANE